jgi:hypothetical protein
VLLQQVLAQVCTSSCCKRMQTLQTLLIHQQLLLQVLLL